MCRKHGVEIKHEAQQLQRSDFDKFDYILAMDSWGNLKNIQKVQPKGSKAKGISLPLSLSSRQTPVLDAPFVGSISRVVWIF